MPFLVSDPRFEDHDTGPGHPERPERLRAILGHLREAGVLGGLHRVEPRPAETEEVLRVHTREHVEKVRAACAERRPLDPDTRVSPGSFELALLGSGGAIAAADRAAAGSVRRGLVLPRPPGHHATSRRAMGFCLLNHVAIAARHLTARHGVERIAIVDFDVHHGNGTEEIFAGDEDVLYVSTHRYPFYPGTGGPHPAGRPPKSTRNLPLPGNTSRERFHEAFERGLDAVSGFRPEFVLVSAGFDAHRDDPIGGLGLVAEDFCRITRGIVEVAEATAGGRVVSLLEGGYGLDALGPCVAAHLEGLA